MFTIIWGTKAVRQLNRILVPKTQKAILEKISELQNFPDCDNVKFLRNHKYDGRLRVGNYRVLFKIMNVIQVISIEEVKNRDDQTY